MLKSLFMKRVVEKDWTEENERFDYIQKIAWQLVRSAEDRIGSGRGTEKLLWCVSELSKKIVTLSADNAEDHIRAAFVNFQSEQKSLME